MALGPVESPRQTISAADLGSEGTFADDPMGRASGYRPAAGHTACEVWHRRDRAARPCRPGGVVNKVVGPADAACTYRTGQRLRGRYPYETHEHRRSTIGPQWTMKICTEGPFSQVRTLMMLRARRDSNP